MMMQDNKDSFKLEKGDVVRVPAGAMVYLVNNDMETLRIAKLMQPVNTPGRFEVIKQEKNSDSDLEMVIVLYNIV